MGNARWRAALALLAVLAGTAAVLVNGTLFPLYSLNRDDSVYVAMARLLESGAVTLPADADAFRPWASAVVGDRVVLKYSPPWPAVIAVGDLLTGTPRAALALTAAATVVLTAALAASVLRDRCAGLVAGALLLLSPVFLVQAGTYLPYLFQLALGLGFATLLLSALRRRSSGRLVAAGAVWGAAAFARPFDALLFAVPFVLYALADTRRARRAGEGGWREVGCALRLAAGAAPLLALSLAYNAVVVGGPLRLPFSVTGPQDGFGFGRRGVFPQSTVDFTPADGVSGLLDNLRWTPSWVFGGIVLVAAAVLGLARTRGPERRPVAALAVVVPLGYLPFWGPWAMSSLWRGVELFGPYYLLPVVVPLVVFGAAGLTWLGRRAGAAPRALTAGVVAAMVLLTALAVPDKTASHAAVGDDLRAVQRFVAAQGLDDAVLLLPRRGDLGFLSTTPFLENDPALDQPVLYAEERGPGDFALLDRFPDRALYRLSEDLPPGGVTGGDLAIDRLTVDAGPEVTLRARLTNPTDRPVVVATLAVGDTVLRRTLDRASTRGRTYEVAWTVAAPAAAAPGPDGVRLPAGAPTGELAVGLDLRTAGDGDRPGRRWERRVAYRCLDRGATVEVLRPGRGWARDDAPGSPWVEAGADNPVEELPTG
ncbi:glycosyltransferase family 39 protein [Geodermatophilus sp. SYSU D00703]